MTKPDAAERIENWLSSKPMWRNDISLRNPTALIGSCITVSLAWQLQRRIRSAIRAAVAAERKKGKSTNKRKDRA